jgi:hypothetical protein
MNVTLKIEANELTHCPDLSHYNYIIWKFTRPTFAGSYLIEKYDDVSDDPEYEFCDLYVNSSKNHGKQVNMIGVGEGINQRFIGVGGIFFEIDLVRPDLSLTLIK